MLSNIGDKKIAYLIGFLAGDGAFCDGFGKRSSRMAMTTVDMDIVKWVSANVEKFSTDNPKFTDNKDAGIFAKQASYTKTFAVKYSEFFNKYSILCKKGERTFNNIAKINMRQFMLGLIDSDGCISFTHRKDRDRIACRISITHPSALLLEKVQTFLMESLCIPSSIKPKGTEKCFVWGFSKLEHVEKFCEWLYSDTNDIILNRKWYKWLELKKEIANKRAEGNCYPKEFMGSFEYGSIIGSMSKYMFLFAGIEYPSATIAGNALGLDSATVQRRCAQENKGFSRRPKTEEEVIKYSAYIDRMIRQAFVKWNEEQ